MTLEMNLDEHFLVQFAFNSLPLEQYRVSQMIYNTIKDKLFVRECS